MTFAITENSFSALGHKYEREQQARYPDLDKKAMKILQIDCSLLLLQVLPTRHSRKERFNYFCE